MQIKIKYPSNNGIIRLENSVNIKEIIVKEDFLHPEKQKIAIGFANDISSGLVEFNFEEFDNLMKSSRRKVKLVKDIKVIKE